MSAGLPAAAARDQTGRWVLIAFGGYFLAQAVLRISLRGALEVDEAEMILLARGWRLGYGPQLPLYNWLQVAAFQALGTGGIALALLKNAVLFAGFALMFLGLGRVLPVAAAAAGTIGLFLLPNVTWEFQRASTHSVALFATVTGTIAATLWLFARPGRGGWSAHLALGLAMGLGGLAKFNYWLVPLALGLAVLGMAGLRARLAPLRLAAAAGLAVAIVAAPYLWILRHKDVALASQAKLYQAETGLPGFVEGLGEAAGGAVAGLVIVALAALPFRPWRATAPVPWPAQLLLRAGGIALAGVAAGIVIGGVSDVHPRWLVPAFCLIAPGVMIRATRGAGPRGIRRLAGVAAALGAVTLAGMAELRVNGATTGGIDFLPLADRVSELAAPGVPVLTNYHIGGNLALLMPGLAVVPPIAAAGGAPPPRVALLLSNTGRPPDPVEYLAARGYAAAGRIRILAEGREDLPYRDAPDARFPVPWRLVATAP